MGVGFRRSAFVRQAEDAIDRMMCVSSQSEISFAGQVLDALVEQVIANARPFDDNVAQLSSLIVNSFSRNPHDSFYNLRAMILERAYRRIDSSY